MKAATAMEFALRSTRFISDTLVGDRPRSGEVGGIEFDMVMKVQWWKKGNHGDAEGTVNRIVVPCPSLLSASMSPRIELTRCFTIARPSPVPP
jgi:hypothetical protein